MIFFTGANETEEDFSWEDDEDESVAPESKSLAALRSSMSSQRTLAPKVADMEDVHSLPSSQFHTPTTMSPRESSEESYDVVSGNVSTAGERAKRDEEEDEESDWE